MATYQYVKTDGTLGTTTDQANAPGIAATSGFMLQQNTSSAITPSSLTATQPFPLVSPTQTPTYPVSTLDATPQITETSQEVKATGLTTQLGDLYNSIVGKDQYQSEQNASAGVNQITQSINDNNTAIRQLQNESAAAKLNADNRQASTFSIAGEQGAIDRSTAVKALTLSSISDALSNNLVAAQNKADQAVAQKYGPIEAQIKATQANLQLILNDPLTSVQDRNRALRQQTAQQQLSDQTALAKQGATEIWGIATTAATNASGFKPAGQYTNLNQTLQAISQAPTKEAALQIALSTGLLGASSSSAKVLGSATTGYFTYDPATGQTTPLGGGGGEPGGGGGGGGGTPTGDIKKGKLTDNGFVNKVLSKMGVSYQDAVDQVPAGEIGVIANATGQVGSILPGEFDSAKYTKL